MHWIEVTHVFSASHQLRLADRTLEPLHSHDWNVTVRIEAADLDQLETVLDFHAVQAALKRICAPLEGRRLNDVPPFEKEFNPSAERVAHYIGMECLAMIDACKDGATRMVRLREVRVTEAAGCVAGWQAKVKS